MIADIFFAALVALFGLTLIAIIVSIVRLIGCDKSDDRTQPADEMIRLLLVPRRGVVPGFTAKEKELIISYIGERMDTRSSDYDAIIDAINHDKPLSSHDQGLLAEMIADDMLVSSKTETSGKITLDM